MCKTNTCTDVGIQNFLSGAFLWSDQDQDQWSMIIHIVIHQRNRWVLWSTMIRVILVQWSWPTSPQKDLIIYIYNVLHYFIPNLLPILAEDQENFPDTKVDIQARYSSYTIMVIILVLSRKLQEKGQMNYLYGKLRRPISLGGPVFHAEFII